MEAVPNGVLQYVDQYTKDLHAGVVRNVNQAGHRITKAQVNPEDNSPLNRIREMVGDATNDVVVEGSKALHGEDAKTYEKTSHGTVAVLVARKRELMKKPWK